MFFIISSACRRVLLQERVNWPMKQTTFEVYSLKKIQMLYLTKLILKVERGIGR
jgi:hypothetical protein